jgi:hypothetical protein
MATVIAAVAAMSLSGLLHFATGEMGWAPLHALILPYALDGAAIAVTAYAYDRIGKGENAVQFRLIAACLVATSAFINWRGALPTGNVGEEWVFPFMSVMVYWMAHAAMGARRRDVRLAQHGKSQKPRTEPLPPFGVLEWMLYPVATFKALRVAVAERMRRAAERSQPRPRVAQLSQSQAVAPSPPQAAAATPQPVAEPHGDVTQMRPADAIRAAVAALSDGRDDATVAAADVVAWLAARGVATEVRRVNETIKRARSRGLRLVPQEEAG